MFETAWKRSLTAVVATTTLITTASIARADITWSGDLEPADPATWTSETMGYIGKIADGTLTIDGDSDLLTGGGYIGYEAGVTGEVNVDGTGSTWTNSGTITVGVSGSGTLAITNGGAVSSHDVQIGKMSLATGLVMVDGTGSTWTNSRLNFVGFSGIGKLAITNGGTVISSCGTEIALSGRSTGEVTVDGTGSMWTNNGYLRIGSQGNGLLNITNGGVVVSDTGTAKCPVVGIGLDPNSTGEVNVIGNGSKWVHKGMLDVGYIGSGTLNISHGGLVTVGGSLTIGSKDNSNSFINIATGGKLAISGEANDSLTEFLDLIGGTGAIRCWDDSISDWADIHGATYGVDYTLEYITDGDLNGYTLLTVGIPEPSAIVMAVVLLGTLVFCHRRRSTSECCPDGAVILQA